MPPELPCVVLMVALETTAVLSSHTGGLGNVVTRDLGDYIDPALEHYRSLGVEFECVYTGFLNSEAQFASCERFICR